MVSINDPLFASQWHFKWLGDIQKIWDDYTGAGVSVGVYDDGIQYTHPDLAANYDATLSFSYGGVTYDPKPIALRGADSDAHGTSVAGLIAAVANNGIGGVGVAFGAKLTGVNLLSDPRLQSDFMTHQAMLHAVNFDIMSNSWGYTPYFLPFQNASDTTSTSAAIIRDYANAAQFGRGGLGTIVVQAAGNDYSNAQADGINTAKELISVAALTTDGSVQAYSNYGANILVAAPAASVTTDLAGNNGYNSATGLAGNYQTTFGGTSAATPLVSGVVALMLEANPALGWRDVKEILATSAKMTGSVAGGPNTFETTGTDFQVIDRLVGGVLTRSSDSWNDGGHAVSWDYGFGRVDAYAAVRLAEVWGLLNGPAHTSANELTYTGSNISVTNLIYSAKSGAATSTVTVPGHLSIEYIALTVNLDFQAASAVADGLSLNLIAPGGSVFALVGGGDLYYSDISNSFTWKFGISHALGMDANGTWTVQLLDAAGASLHHTGSINSVSLEFSGAAFDTNNIHHVTQDFLLANSADAGGLRDKAINDSNGGVDWLEMATLAGNVVVSLAANSNFSVAGKIWGKIAAGTVIENIVTGDGDDRIVGNATANKIFTGRGNDYVNAGAGNDRAVGGHGDDTLLGGLGGDTLMGDTGNDSLVGGAGNDVLSGGLGADVLLGGDGADQLEGNAGQDSLTGNAGADRFVFRYLDGSDVITDFVDNVDTLLLDKTLWDRAPMSVATLLATFATFMDNTVVLNFGEGDRMTIYGLTSTNALLDDLLFI